MIKNKLQELLLPLINDLGYELWGCEYLSQGRHSLLRIYIDKEDGIGIGDCERVSKQVSALLDVEDPISGNYSLEVSSPGIPRPLFSKEQYIRYLGAPIKVRLYKPIAGSKNLEGTIEAVNDETVLLKIDNVEYAIPFSEILKAHLRGE